MILLGCDNAFTINGVQDAITLAFVDNATITGSVATLDGTTLATMDGSYISGSNGNYLCILTAAQTASLTACTEYVITLTATNGTLTREFQDIHLAITGGFTDA